MSRIAIIGPAYPYRGGPPLVVANLYEQLVSRGHQVEVFSFTRLYPSLLFPGVRQEDVSKHPQKAHPVTRVIDSVNPFTWLNASKLIADFKPDIVLVDWYQPFFGLCYHTILRALKRIGVRVVFLTENVISHEARAIDTFLTKLALQHADSFIAFSESVESRLTEWYKGKKISRSTLPLFFTQETSPIQWTSQSAKEKLGLQGKRVLLFFGYIRKYKGLRKLIEAFPLIADEFGDVHLLIVGECYESADEYNAMIQSSGYSNRITWINEYVPNEDVGLYYNSADIIVLPYESATQSGIVKIAFGYGKPVVATNVGGLAEEISAWNAGIVVEHNSPAIFANGVATMLRLSSLKEYSDGAVKAKNANSFDGIGELVEKHIG
jgi:glycosyltransferase involved in cell wall biosynthesis